MDVRASAIADLAVARINNASAELKMLPLSKAVAIPGESVVVVGYPAGTTAMLTKSPQCFIGWRRNEMRACMSVLKAEQAHS